MRLTAASRIDRSDLPGAPNEPWVDSLIEFINASNRQLFAALDRLLNTADNSVDAAIAVNLVDGVQTPQQNPLDVPIQGIWPVRCQGINVDSTGKPTRGNYALGMPRIDWVPSSSGGALITATFPTAGAHGRVRLFFFGG